MRLGRLKVSGVGNIADVDLDFSSLPSGVIAVVGSNGAGKTTLLEASGPAALYRQFPFNRETIQQKSSGSSLIRVEYFADRKYVVTHRAESGHQEAFLEVDGVGCAGPKVTDFDRGIARYFPPSVVFSCSAFAVQGGAGGFFSLERAERRTLFARLLGIERYESIARTASEQASALQSELAGKESSIRLMLDHLNSVEELRAGLSAAEQELDRLGESVRLEEERLLAMEKEHAEASRRHAVRLERVRAMESRMDAARKRIDSIRGGMEERRRELSQLADILRSASEADPKKVDAAFETALAEQREARNRLDAMVARRNSFQLAWTKEDGVLSELKSEIASVSKNLQREIGAIMDQIGQANSLLGGFRGVDLANPMCRSCSLTAEAVRVSESLPVLEGRLVEARASAERRIDRLRAEAQAREEAVREAKRKMEEAEIAARRASLEMRDIEQRVGQLSEQRRKLLDVADLRNRSAVITAELGQLAAALQAEEAALAKLCEEMAAEGKPDDIDGSAMRLARQRDAVAAMRGRAAETSASVERLRGEIDSIGRVAAAAGNLEAELERLRGDLAAWKGLADAMLGLRVVEIDGSCPAVTEIANALLEDFRDGAFRVKLDTLTEKKSGGMKEDFTATIIDTRSGRSGAAVSGGERAIIDEALRLAICIFNVQKSGFPMQTLWRDEAAGALDPEGASLYIAMLRKAREIGGFHQVIIVSHHEHVWRQADARIHLEGGSIRAID